MNPWVIGALGVAGYAYVAKKGPFAHSGPDDASKQQKQGIDDAWPSWLHIGNQPSTGQGQSPTETIDAVAGAVKGVASLGSQLAAYWGTSKGDSAPGSVGTNGSGGSEWPRGRCVGEVIFIERLVRRSIWRAFVCNF